MREFTLILLLSALSRARSEAGYSHGPSSNFNRGSDNNIGGYYHSGGRDTDNGYSYNRPIERPTYGVPEIQDNSLNYLPPKRPRPTFRPTFPTPTGSSLGGGGGIGGGGVSVGSSGSIDDLDQPQFNPGGLQIGRTRVQTSAYAFTPPKDFDEFPSVIPTLTPQPKINYKIIFIKAPTPPTPTVPQIPVLTQDQEKTLIYVLVKRPEEAPQITIPTVAPPSKPEVYFIRYRTQKETKAIDGVRQPAPKYGPPGYNGPH